MALAITLQEYLSSHEIEFDLLTHAPAPTSNRTAQASHVSGDKVAKAVILKHEEGFFMAVVPATHHIRLAEISRMMQRRVGLATEQEADALFDDCASGAFPAVGAAYGLDVIVDDSLARAPDLYFEAGDHATLVHVDAEAFGKLIGSAPRGSFSQHD